MKRIIEKNVDKFNHDVKTKGRYQYTNFESYSAAIATKRQTQEMVKLLTQYVKKKKRILDVGCGDGTFTMDLLKELRPYKIVGFDTAKSAIKFANKQLDISKHKNVSFLNGNIYDTHKIFKDELFDVVIIRGVLHHLYDPVRGIESVCKVADSIIILEPNGYNPILKIIEKVSPYHIAHEEKSYWPPNLNRWFEQNGFRVKKQIFFSIVPYFAPKVMVKFLKTIEKYIETLPVLKLFFCGTNLVMYEKK